MLRGRGWREWSQDAEFYLGTSLLRDGLFFLGVGGGTVIPLSSS